jgi:MFS family permease
MLGTAANLQIIAGPAIGGVVIGLTSTSVAFVVDAASFLICAVLLARLPSMPPHTAATEGIWQSTIAGVCYCARNPRVRALAVGTLVFVSFAAIDNVALVFLVRRSLHGSRTEYGLVVAGFGLGLLVASLALGRCAGRVSGQRWLLFGVVIGAAGTAGTGLAPDAATATIAQLVAGAGNTLDVVATDTLVQRLVPREMLGRVFGSIGTAAQSGSAVAYLAAAPLVAAAGARVAFVVAAAGMILGLAALGPALRRDGTDKGAAVPTARDALPDPLG